MNLSVRRAPLSARTIILAAVLLLSAAAAVLLRPTLYEDQDPPELDTLVPKQVGQWRVFQSPVIQVSLTDGTANNINQPYDQTVMRTYVDPQGHAIQLALAWGRHQRQEVKIHRPELCYPAQGLKIESLRDVAFSLNAPSGEPVVGKRMIARDSRGMKEVVSYWIRIGHIYSSGALATRKHILMEGLAGHVTDGVLVRVSQRIANDQDENAAFERQESFITQLVSSTPASAKQLLIK